MSKTESETPIKNKQPARSRNSSSGVKSPRTRKMVGDELGKNKKQQLIYSYFSPTSSQQPPTKEETRVKKGNPSRRELFSERVPARRLIESEILISDDEDQLSMEEFHVKTKTISIKSKNRKVGLSRKSLKLKSTPADSVSSENKVTITSRTTASLIVDSHTQKSGNFASNAVKTSRDVDSAFECSPIKRFRKQNFEQSQGIYSDDSEGSGILMVIGPNNNNIPSMLSTKSRKRKITEPDTRNSTPCDVSKATVKNIESVSTTDVNCADLLEIGSNLAMLSAKDQVVGSHSVLESGTIESANSSDDLSGLFRDSQLIDVNMGDANIKTARVSPVPIMKTEKLSPPVHNLGHAHSSVRIKTEPLSPVTESTYSAIQPERNLKSTHIKTEPLSPVIPISLSQVKVEPTVEFICSTGVKMGDHPKLLSSSTAPLLRSASQTLAPSAVSSFSECSATLPRQTEGLKTLAGEAVGLKDINWSEPMEQEVILGNTPKKNPNGLQTPQKLHDYSCGASPVKTMNPVKLFPSTPSKSSAGPSNHGSLTPLKKTPSKSPTKGSPRKNGSPMKLDKEAISGNVLFEHCITECKRYAHMALKLNATNKTVADEYLSLCLPEKILLHYLLMRKWSWIRQVDMKYDRIVHNKAHSLDVLRDKGFLEDITLDEELDLILGELKRPELEQLCKQHKVDSSGTKVELAARLHTFSTRQGGLGFSSKSLKTVMKQAAFTLLGRCVRLAEGARNALQKIFEATMSPLYLEGQYYSFQERLRGMETLMNDVKFRGKKLIPFNLSDNQLFMTTAQFDEYVTSVILKFDILSARDKRDTKKGIELAKDARVSLLIYINSKPVKDFLEKTPRYIWRYTAGSSYTSALDTGIELFKKAKEYEDAVLAIDILLAQGWFRKHCRGHWYAEKVLIMDKHLKKCADELYAVLLKGLKEDLTALGRLELSKRAEGIINKKKGGLSPDQKEELRQLLRLPRLNHKVKEMKSAEAPNMSTGTRQTYVEISKDGERTYSDVETTARNSYMGEFPEGLHDEGAFLKNIILAAFWPVIYLPMENMFVSRYQHSPLDWGTQAFYKNRQSHIEEHICRLRKGGVDGILEQITDVLTVYANHHSLIHWFYINHDMLPNIRNIIASLTVDKFLKLANYLLESFRERRSGWPDLTLWNTVTGRFKLVEVKSTNDELSFKQIVWLEKFAEMGIDAEECRVNASNKGKRRKAQVSTPFSDASQEVM